MNLTLVIGHKFNSKGACNEQYNLCEYDYNDTFVNKLIKVLDKIHNVYVTIVYRDIYKELPEDINNTNPDIILSFHCNAFNKKASGTEVLFYHKSRKGRALATNLQEKLVDALQLPNRGIKPKAAEDRGGYLLCYTKAPCLIVEPFFIDNNNDLQVALNRQAELLDAYKEFIIDFI
jgi:N-acetylmuramoyl-L-alanine amidase